MSGVHLMRPEWLWLALPALALGYALWRRQERTVWVVYEVECER